MSPPSPRAASRPRHRRNEEANTMAPELSVTSQGASAPPDTARVLVVDDEAYITDLVATALRYEGFEVASAASGREALTLVDSFRPDLIVLDSLLPGV